MGDAKRKQEARQRVWRWCLTLGERIETWRLLLGRKPESEDADELNTRAVEAIEANDEFEPPPHLKGDDRKKWHEEFNARIVSEDRDELGVTLEDIEQVRTAVREAIESEKKRKCPKCGHEIERTSQWDGARGYRLRRVKRAVKAAMAGDSIDGVIWPVSAPEPEAESDGDNGSSPRKRRARRPKGGGASPE